MKAKEQGKVEDVEKVELGDQEKDNGKVKVECEVELNYVDQGQEEDTEKITAEEMEEGWKWKEGTMEARGARRTKGIGTRRRR